MTDQRCPPGPLGPTTDQESASHSGHARGVESSPGRVRRLAEEQAERYAGLRAFIQERLDWSDTELDRVVHRIARPLYEAVDCTSCANCCRAMLVSMQPGDAPRLARYLRLTEADLAARYLAVSERGEKVIAGAPCPFLRGLRCSVYTVRPRSCRDFPHLLRGSFRSRLPSLLASAAECPIVFNTLERLMLAVGFR